MHKLLANCSGCEWDEGNSGKNRILHSVSNSECEEGFFNRPLIVRDDKKHSKAEKRYYVLGRADSNRHLFIAFTIRKKWRNALSFGLPRLAKSAWGPTDLKKLRNIKTGE
jgi:hypothetical protein